MDSARIVQAVFARTGRQIDPNDALMDVAALLDLYREDDKERAIRQARDLSTKLSRSIDSMVRDRFRLWFLAAAFLAIVLLGMVHMLDRWVFLVPAPTYAGPMQCEKHDTGAWCWIAANGKTASK